MKQWVSEQWRSPLHLSAVMLYPFILFLSYLDPIFLYAGFAVFFLVTSIRLMWKMVFFMLAVGVILAILPFLAPFAVILMIILFLLRIGYVVQNWRPFATGLLIYGGAVPLYYRTEELHQWSDQMPSLTEPLVVAAIGGIVLHMLLVWQYRKGYSTQRALGIMGSVPLIIIAFVLPFLKLHVGFGEAGPDFAHAGHGVGPDGHLAAAEGAHGDLVHVKTYVRTAPDGDPTNNLSYHGPDAKPVNPEGLHIVKAHDRTMPDGDPANNLSYDGGSSGSGSPDDLPNVGTHHAQASAVAHPTHTTHQTHQTGTVYVPPKGEAEPLMRPGQVLALLGMIGIIAALIWFIVDLKSGESRSTNEPMIAESSAAASETPSRYWVVTSIQANVRENPDPDAPVKQIIDQGMRLKFLEEQQSDEAGRLWYKVEVESDSITGWISSKIVREE